MKKEILSSVVSVSIVWVVALATTTHARGPLVPPDAPAPTMRILQQIEPRTPITRNGFAGIHLNNAAGNRIENNHITRQAGPSTYGIYSAFTTHNYIFSNTAYGNATNFLVTTNDIYEPIVTNTGSLATSGAAAHPRANFSRSGEVII